jgi:hypothetical protein
MRRGASVLSALSSCGRCLRGLCKSAGVDQHATSACDKHYEACQATHPAKSPPRRVSEHRSAHGGPSRRDRGREPIPSLLPRTDDEWLPERVRLDLVESSGAPRMPPRTLCSRCRRRNRRPPQILAHRLLYSARNTRTWCASVDGGASSPVRISHLRKSPEENAACD